MKERRRFPRYDVAKMENLRGELAKGRARTRLVLFGAGGCGFFSSPSEEKIADGTEVDCTFYCAEVLREPIILKARIAYSQLVTINKVKEIYYGLEFNAEQSSRIQPIIKFLDQQASAGKIKVSA